MITDNHAPRWRKPRYSAMALTAGLMIAGTAGCRPTHEAAAIPAPTKPACTGSVVTIKAGEFPDCDVIPPQRLDQIMSTGVEMSEASALMFGKLCDDMGGELIFDPANTQYVCEGIDY
jgi:hypothetical protein